MRCADDDAFTPLLSIASRLSSDLPRRLMRIGIFLVDGLTGRPPGCEHRPAHD
jgi:hypothetical protein